MDPLSGRAAGKMAVARPRPLSKGRRTSPYLFCLPFGILFALFFLGPIGYAVYLSVHALHHPGIYSPPVQYFSGFSNYLEAFREPAMYQGILRVLLLGVVQVPVMLGLALVLALVLERPATRMRGFFRTIYFLPYAVPGVIGAIMWSFLYYPSLSPFDQLYSHLGAGTLNLLSGKLVLWSIANIITWEWTGYNFIILSAGLQGIPPDLFEAAKVDGASELKIALRIKIPLITPALVLTLIFSIIGTLQTFNEPYILYTLGASSVSSVYTPAMNIFFTNGEPNPYFASAMAVILAAVTAVLSFGALRLVRRRSGI
jgi:multiple sugar transport system permease protein